MKTLPHFLTRSLPFIICTWAIIGADAFAWPPERMFVHTDREIYLAGETLHFKTYLLHANNDRTEQSGIAYLALRNRFGTVSSLVLPLQGQGNEGNIYLEDTLSSGWYELIAFTNRMRLEHGETRYRKTLFVANRFDRDPLGSVSGDMNDPDHETGVSGGTGSCLSGEQTESDQTAQQGPSLRMEMDAVYGTRESVRMQLFLDEIRGTFATLSVSVSPALACNEAAPGLSAIMPVTEGGWSPATGAGMDADAPSDYWEKNAYLLHGRVRKKQTDEAAEGVRIVLNTPGAGITYLYDVSRPDGKFCIPLPAFYNGRLLYLSADPETTGDPVTVEVDNKFSFSGEFHPQVIAGMEARREFIRRSQELLSARQAFRLDYLRRTGRQALPASPPSFLFPQPRLTVRPAQYTPLDNLQEIAREIVPPWRIRQSGDSYRSQLHCADTGSPLPGTPLYFVDGIQVHDLGCLLPLQSAQIDRILVHNTEWSYHDRSYHGAIQIITHGNDYINLIPKDQYTTTRFDFYQKENTFNPPSHSNGNTINREQPDLRQTLYWNPEIRIRRGGSADLHFYTGDLPGEYLVRVEGITSDGKGITLFRKFKVGL